jgi:glycolate oxidase subunit GlcD
MNRILELDPKGRRARLQAGVVNAELTRAARPHGLHYAPDPSSQTACTIGGNVAENSGGPHCLKYGVTSRYVTGLTVVSPVGRVVRLDVDRAGEAGLVGAFVGSEGCFGLVTEVQVRLVPLARGVRTLLAAFPTLQAAGAAVSDLIARGALPAALEILDRHTVRAVEESVFAAGYPRDAGAVLVAEFDGSPGELEEGAALARGRFAEHGATQVREARDEVERAALWKGRKKAFGAMGRLAPDLLVQDATVPRSALPGVLAAIDEVARRHELRVANVFHAGDGNLHPNLVFDRRDAGQVARVEAASREIMQLCVDAGGTITGEHGVGVDKRAYMSMVHSPEELALQRRVRSVFDPAGRWNPGKVLPDTDTPPAGAPLVRRGAAEGEDGVVHYEPADLVITVDAGVRWFDLQARVAREGQWVPVDARGISELTVGEVVAEGAESALAASHGALRDLLLGALLELPGGSRVQLGGQVVKNVAGFQLLPFVVGHRGRLGQLRRGTLRLWPAPEVDRTLVVRGESPQELAPLADAVAALSLPPDAVELIWGTADDEVDPAGGAQLRVRAVGSRARTAATLEAVRGLDCGVGAKWTIQEGVGSRIPARTGRADVARRGGFRGSTDEAVAWVGGPVGWVLVDQGVALRPGGAAVDGLAGSGDSPATRDQQVRRWLEGIRSAFGEGTDGMGRVGS